MDIVMIILIISGVLLLYLLLGYLPGRAIRRKRNRWQAWGFFGQIWGWIDGDKKRILPALMPPGLGAVFFTLSRTEFVEDGKTEAYTETSKDGKTIYYHKALQINGIKKPVRTVVEEITRLRKTENHPYIVEVKLPKTGLTFYLVFTIKAKIKNPNKVIKMDEFLLFIGNQLNDRVFPWAVRHEADLEARHPDISKVDLTNLIVDDIIGLNIDDDDSIKFMVKGIETNLKTYMNSVIAEYGGDVDDFSLDVGYDDSVKEILELRKKQSLELERLRLQTNENATRAKEREREKADADQERELDKKYQDEVAIPALEAEAEAQKKANEGWSVGTLMMGDSQKQPSLLIQERPNRKKAGGANA